MNHAASTSTATPLMLDFAYRHEAERPNQVYLTQPIGGGQVVTLANGNFVHAQPNWDNGAVVDAGTISIAGANLAELSDKTRTTFRARNMGFVFQTYNLLPVLSAVENVELPLIVSGVRPKEARQRALEALATVGLQDRANQRPNQLSGGQRQRVTVARALVNRPSIIWADEPTGALDSKTATEIMDLISALNEQDHQTTIIVTHDPKVAARCHRTIHMADGVIVREDSQEKMRAVAAASGGAS